jgi:hypothetical protein
METIYENFKIEYDNTFGEPHVMLHIDAKQGKDTAFFMLSFDRLRRFLKVNHPNEAKYIDTIRSGLSGYGPKEDKIIEILEKEAFDFEKYMIFWIESVENRVTQEIERQYKMAENPSHLEKLDSFLDLFDKYIIKEPINTSQFMDELEQVVLNHLIDNYPELTNAEPEDIKRLSHILINHIPNLSVELIDHIHDIRKKKEE